MEKARYEVQPKYPIGILTYHFINHPRIWKHWHEYLEIIYIKEGKIKIRADRNVFDAGKNDIVIFNSFEVHESLSMSPKSEYFVFVVPPEFMGRENANEYYRFDHIIKGDKQCLDIVRCLAPMIEEGERRANFLVTGYVFQLLHYLTERYSKVQQNKIGDVNDTKRIVEDLKTRISYCYAEQLNISMLASSFGISESHLQHCFKQETGTGIVDFINRTRVENAVTLLKTTELRISDISEAVGFLDYNYFSRVFKKYKGVTPSQYRVGEKC